MSEVNYKRDVRQAMHDYLPKYYEDIREARAILDGEADQIIRLNADINDVLAQFFVDTATWGLAYWERMIGDENAGKDDATTHDSLEANNVMYETIDYVTWNTLEAMFPQETDQRRANLKAKIRGFGTVTTALIKSVAESYANGEVEVIEDTANYAITINFVGELGVPEKISDIQTALRVIIPAHLTVAYTFKYVTYDQSEITYATYDDLTLSGKTYDDILNGR